MNVTHPCKRRDASKLINQSLTESAGKGNEVRPYRSHYFSILKPEVNFARKAKMLQAYRETHPTNLIFKMAC